MFAKAEQKNLSGIEDRTDSHRERPAGYVFLSEEVTGCIPTGDTIERNQAGPRHFTGAGFIEPDMAGATDPQDLDIDAPRFRNSLLVPQAGVLDVTFVHSTIGNMDIVRLNIDQVKEILPHETDVALQFVGLHREVLVQIEGDDIGQGEVFFPMHADQFVVDADRSASRCQSEDTRASL